MSAGMADQRPTKASPPRSSNAKTIAFAAMMAIVMTGRWRGRRDASPNGSAVPMRVQRTPVAGLGNSFAGMPRCRHYCNDSGGVGDDHERRLYDYLGSR